jgi:hypothetical protein
VSVKRARPGASKRAEQETRLRRIRTRSRNEADDGAASVQQRRRVAVAAVAPVAGVLQQAAADAQCVASNTPVGEPFNAENPQRATGILLAVAADMRNQPALHTRGLSAAHASFATVLCLTACTMSTEDFEDTGTDAQELSVALKGATSSSPADGAVNHCVIDPVGQIESLRTHGEVLGFHMDAGYPIPTCGDTVCDDHWQSIQRLAVGDGRAVAVSSSDQDEGGHVALVRMGSRRADRLRFRGNRMSYFNADWNVAPQYPDRIALDLGVCDGCQNLDHPGGLQAMGRYLFVPIENVGSSSGNPFFKAGVSIYDLCYGDDAWACDPTANPTEVAYYDKLQGASWVAASRLADARWLMIVGNNGARRMDFHVSQGTSLEVASPFGQPDAPQQTLECHYVGSYKVCNNAGLYDFPPSSSFDSTWGYQNVQLITECGTGQLYLVASHYTGTTFLGGEDWVDLWKLGLSQDGTSYAVTLEKVANQHLYCGTPGGKQCELDAAGGPYIDPRGRMLFYAAEHDNDGPGGSVKMMEFRPTNLDPGVSAPCTRETAWVELYENSNFTGRALFIELADRAARNYNDFGVAAAFHDEAKSARWCMPQGVRFRLWPHSNQGGTPQDLLGTGSLATRTWSSSIFNPGPGWSSGCFHDGVSCIAGPSCGDGVCDGAESPTTCAADCGLAHSKCQVGSALRAGADLCVTAICGADSFCCSNSWDSLCAQEVRTVCENLSCSESAGSCTHPLCSTGAKLTNACDATKTNCVSAICAVDPYCCNVAWDSICVAEVASVCDKRCG